MLAARGTRRKDRNGQRDHMGVTSLSEVINERLVLRFTGLASSGNGNPITQGSSQTSISQGLRVGAQSFAQAVQGLNSAITFLNLGRDTLEKLTKVTDKLITLTEKATKISTSSDNRKNLELDFNRIAGEFQKIVEDAKFGERDLLNLDDMSELFTLLGLDQETSDSVAKIFKQFTTPEEDPDNLASEAVKGKRPYFVPAAAFRKPQASEQYYLEKISEGGVIDSGISTVNSVYTAVDNTLNQNPGRVAIFTRDESGSVQTMPAGTLTSDVTLRTVNENNGYSVIESTDDFLGFNAAGVKQLFLVNPNAEVVHQFTNESTNVNFAQVSISQDNLTIGYYRRDGTDRTVRTIESSTFGENPTAGVNTLRDTLGATDSVSSLEVNNDASRIGYVKIVGGVNVLEIRDMATNVADSYINTVSDMGSRFGFYDSNKVAFESALGGVTSIVLYDTDTTFDNPLITSNPVLSPLRTLERTTGSEGYITFFDYSFVFADLSLVTYSVSGTTETEYLFSTFASASPPAFTDQIYSTSLAFNSNGQPEIMLRAELSEVTGDTDTELYRLRAKPPQSSQASLARSTKEYETIFDGTYDILNRPNAYRMLHDLKALRTQLTDNIDGIDYATDIIGKNLDFVRAAGFAFLNLSSTISASDDAETVAGLLRDEIRKNAAGALAQAENLQNIAVAALALNEDSILGRS
jgi:hypothetical protein